MQLAAKNLNLENASLKNSDIRNRAPEMSAFFSGNHSNNIGYRRRSNTQITPGTAANIFKNWQIKFEGSKQGTGWLIKAATKKKFNNFFSI